MSDPKAENLGRGFDKPPLGEHTLTITNFESKTSSKDRKSYLAADFTVAETGKVVSYAWFIEKDEYGYVMASLRRFIDAAARKGSQQDADFYARVLGKALDGTDALVGVQVRCSAKERAYKSKAGKEGTTTEYAWSIADETADERTVKAGNARRRVEILGGVEPAPQPAPVKVTPAPAPATKRVAPAPAPSDLDEEEAPF